MNGNYKYVKNRIYNNEVISYSNIDTSGGQSGAPIFASNNNIIGIHTHAYYKKYNNNYGCAFDNNKLKWINNILNNNKTSISTQNNEHNLLRINMNRFKYIWNSDNLIVNENETKTLQSDTVHKYSNIIIKKGAKLTTNKYDLDTKLGGMLLLKVTNNLILQQNATIDMNGKGYPGGAPTSDGYGPGQGKYGLNIHAGYGTKGYLGRNRDSGTIYGNKHLTVLHLGSGGAGGVSDDIGNGGNGGGCLKIIAKNVTLLDGGGIYCNGSTGGTETITGQAGHGSGGTIHIICNKLDNNGEICAFGGSNKFGFGGDGRVRVECDIIINAGINKRQGIIERKNMVDKQIIDANKYANRVIKNLEAIN